MERMPDEPNRRRYERDLLIVFRQVLENAQGMVEAIPPGAAVPMAIYSQIRQQAERTLREPIGRIAHDAAFRMDQHIDSPLAVSMTLGIAQQAASKITSQVADVLVQRIKARVDSSDEEAEAAALALVVVALLKEAELERLTVEAVVTSITDVENALAFAVDEQLQVDYQEYVLAEEDPLKWRQQAAAEEESEEEKLRQRVIDIDTEDRTSATGRQLPVEPPAEKPQPVVDTKPLPAPVPETAEEIVEQHMEEELPPLLDETGEVIVEKIPIERKVPPPTLEGPPRAGRRVRPDEQRDIEPADYADAFDDYLAEFEGEETPPPPELVMVWKVEKDPNTGMPDSRVCPICEPMNDVPRPMLPPQYRYGPPAHPWCRCWMEWEYWAAGGPLTDPRVYPFPK
jgi:hypothetical protein